MFVSSRQFALLRTLIAVPAFAMALWALAGQQGEASILGPSLGISDLGIDHSRPLNSAHLSEALDKLTQADSDASTTSVPRESSSSGSDSLPFSPDPIDQHDQSPQYVLLQGSGNTGTSTTSTSSSAGGAGGGVSLAVLATPAAILTDNSPIERYAAELSLFLPDPPGTELLRPPQN